MQLQSKELHEIIELSKKELIDSNRRLQLSVANEKSSLNMIFAINEREQLKINRIDSIIFDLKKKKEKTNITKDELMEVIDSVHDLIESIKLDDPLNF